MSLAWHGLMIYYQVTFISILFHKVCEIYHNSKYRIELSYNTAFYNVVYYVVKYHDIVHSNIAYYNALNINLEPCNALH